jgi:hypothetical protein
MYSVTSFSRALAVVAGALLLGACETPLPDPQSAGAQIYQVRCSGCHRVYEPRSMTTAMWEVQVQRMQEEMLRRGVNPLTEQEHHLVMSYLKAHSSDAAPAGP